MESALVNASSDQQRIASLIPSGTDLVCALGLAHCLVGVSHECDHLDAVGLPVLTSSVIPPPTIDGPSISPLEIDRLVCSTVQAGDSLYITDRPLLHSLTPTHLVSQDVCDVCAVNADSAQCDIPPNCDLVLLTATSIGGLYDDIDRLATFLSVPKEGQRLVDHVRRNLDAVSLEGERLATLRGRRPRVLTLEWSDPPFLGGHWVPELVELIGAEHVLSGPGEPSRRSTWEEIAEADPDIIIFCPCGYSLHQAQLEARKLFLRPEVANLGAVRDDQFFAVDANRLLSRCTTNLVEASAVLFDIIWGQTMNEPQDGYLRLQLAAST